MNKKSVNNEHYQQFIPEDIIEILLHSYNAIRNYHKESPY